MSSPSTSSEARQPRRTGVLLLVALLAVVDGLAFYLYREAREKVAGGLASRLEAVGTAAVAALRSGALRDAGDLRRYLAALRSGARLENAFVFDPALRSLGDARPAIRPGKRYDRLQLDAAAARAASRGGTRIADQYDVEGLRFLGAYFPAQGVAPGAVLYLETPVSYLRPLGELRLAFVLTIAVSLAALALVAAASILSERALARARVAADRARQLAALGEMAAKVAHEVRNPLAIIRGSAELLREDVGSVASPRVEVVLDEVERLDRLVGDFLTLGREPSARREPVELVGLARELLAREPLAGGGRVQLRAAEATLTVAGDPDRLRQVLLNLVRNACQASDEAPVEVALERRGGEALIRVRDRGPGVSPEVAQRIFEPFVSGRDRGSGLGLPVSRRIVEGHGGTLELCPVQGPGAEFLVTLPLA